MPKASRKALADFALYRAVVRKPKEIGDPVYMVKMGVAKGDLLLFSNSSVSWPCRMPSWFSQLPLNVMMVMSYPPQRHSERVGSLWVVD